MALRIEKKAYFYKEPSLYIGYLFYYLSVFTGFILAAITDNGFYIIIFLLPVGFLAVAIGQSIGEMLKTSNSKNYGFKQGKTQVSSAASSNEIAAADNGEIPLQICFDAQKRRHYWTYHKLFFSTTDNMNKIEFDRNYSNYISKKSTHVYLINQDDSRMYKIGVTNNVKRRFSSIQTSNPNKLSLIYSGKVNDAKKLEKKMHTHFKKQKVRLEWFKLDPPDVKYVIRRIDEGAYAEPVEQS